MKHLKNLKESNFDKSQEMIYDLEDMALELIQDHGVSVDIIPELFKDSDVVRYLIAIEFKSDKIDQYVQFFKSVYSISKSNRYKMRVKMTTRPFGSNLDIPITSSKSIDNIFPNIILKSIHNLKIELTKYKKVEKGSIVAKRKKLNDIFTSDEFGLLNNENTNMKHLMRFNENFEDIQDVQQDILDIFLPLENTHASVSVNSGLGGKSNHIAIEVVANITYNGFDDVEKEVLKDILKQFENWLSYNEFEIADELESDCSYIELIEGETICPECGSYEIDSSGYDYESGKSWCECEDCGHRENDHAFDDRYPNFYDFEKLNKILFETDENKIQHAVSFNIVIKV